MLVDHQLVAEKVEVHPLGAGAAFLQAENLAVEGSGGGEVVNGNRQMEGGKAHRILR
ncbi:hypothetical protein D3C86_2257630 [compost metagenome]